MSEFEWHNLTRKMGYKSEAEAVDAMEKVKPILRASFQGALNRKLASGFEKVEEPKENSFCTGWSPSSDSFFVELGYTVTLCPKQD